MQLNDRFGQALDFTFQLHRAQSRKGGQTPYLAHLLAVAALVIEAGGSEDEAIAGLLHDAPEDQGGSEILEQIRNLFGDQVAAKPAWRERKERYLNHLPHVSEQIRRVSLADKLHNAGAILRDYRLLGENIWDWFNGGKEGTLWYYRALVGIFQNSGFDWMTQELDRIVSEIEQLALEGTAGELLE
jgi:(p)ppGpp synthase/HD superfamily hydrolase